MAVKEFGKDWTKSDALKSVLWFCLHLVIFFLIAALLLWGDKLSEIGEMFSKEGANYLYAIFCIFLLIIFTYFYFYFET